MKPSSNILASSNNQQGCQTLFAPEMQTGTTDVAFTFGINGSLRKVETHFPDHDMEHYLFNSAANLKAYGSDAMYYAYYGYNASNTRTYKLGLPFSFQWQNGQLVKVCIQPEQAMFYPNAYLNFNRNGEYTKHYYSGTERICFRLGGQTVPIAVPDNALLRTRTTQAGQRFRSDIQNLDGSSTPVALYPISVDDLQPTGNTTDIYYYHTNHLGSTAFVTDQNRNITQGFLYAPFGEITTEYAPLWQNGTLPKYAFNAKELDEETGMYYYEARYYKPPVFTSRDPMFEKYFWMTPYAYCANNPVKYVDPSGEEMWQPEITENGEVNYVAEKGDSKESFKSQYGLSEAEASDIFKVANLPQQGEISNGTKISSKDVKKVTGSEVLKLDWNSTKATPQRKVYHIGLALLYENLHGNGHFALNKYFYNMPQSTGDQSNRNFHGNLRIPIKGGSIPICNLNMSASGKTILYMDGLFKQNDRGDMNQFYNVFNPNGKNMKQQLGNLPMLLITIPLEYSDVFDNNYRR